MRLIFILGLVFTAIIVSAVAVTSVLGVFDKDFRGSIADIGGAFSLVDHRGTKVTHRSWSNKYLLVYFGYTYCPDVCPTELQKMVMALDELERPYSERVQPLFITIDPERDTIDVLAEYVVSFHPRLLGLTGDMKEIRNAAKVFRVYYAKPDGQDNVDYLLDHSSFIYLLSPNGSLVEYFSPKTEVSDIAKMIARHL